ncbi:Nif3-like dinuclear metal center hexameric protein [Ligilactobacillus ceti]|uniref:GTP cyclohydrolase 1 type 2 homolog n=1 Tax=Ligilactobacillus ceti DSM 22408 TaxID=1122146 RepID=A0A0R2KMH3_9LACO|nr:Nif3-like dinuclear metal center hexameric protein [Ligilactobacillus ceti]KRN88854.1 hypothetical protein IV53_GL000824 [Ligilactobacillus ceti DSM 22408]
MTKVSEVVARFEKFAPKWLAEKWDNVGLQLGDLNQEVHKMMITLDVRPEVVQEAIENNVDFIFAHHPMMFSPIKTFDLSDPQNKMYAELIKHNITVYAAHTNLDNTNGGMNDWLAKSLGLENVTNLIPVHSQKNCKLVVYVPESHVRHVLEALEEAGAGEVGNYTGCSFTSTGLGRFIPNESAEPVFGEVGKMQEVREQKIEVVIPEKNKQQVIDAILAVHPYEEVVYDIFALENDSSETYALGRVGELPKPMTLQACGELCQSKFQTAGLRLISQQKNKIIKKVAILGGSGSKFYPAAVKKGADLYITGDVTYHTGHDMLASGLSVLDPGHYIESICKPEMLKIFNKWSAENDWNFDIMISTVNTDPFIFI